METGPRVAHAVSSGTCHFCMAAWRCRSRWRGRLLGRTSPARSAASRTPMLRRRSGAPKPSGC